jgi:hypothetical protein
MDAVSYPLIIDHSLDGTSAKDLHLFGLIGRYLAGFRIGL